MDSIKGLIEVFEEFQHMDFVEENVSGDASGSKTRYRLLIES